MKYRLGDICTITKGATGIMKAIPGPYTMIALGETDKTHIEYQFDTKAVIIPLVSSTGHGHASMKRVKYCEGKFALGNILCAVIPNDESFVLAKYLHIYLHWNREELLVSQMKGMANVSLPMNRIADVMVTVPSIDKQREIIELEKQLVEKELKADSLFADQLTQLENLNQAILQEAVQGKLVPQEPKDEPASELLKRIKAEKMNRHVVSTRAKKEKTLPPIQPEEIPFEIPENWVWCRLGDVCEINPRNKVDDELDAGFIPMPMVSQLFGIKPTYEVRKWGAIKTGFTHFANNDVVVAKITPCFENSKAGIISDLPNGIGAGTTELNVLRGNQYVLPEYIYAFVKRIDFLKNGERIMKGVAGQQRVPTEYFYNTLIPLPPLSEQKRIVAEIEKQLAKTKQLKEHIIANKQATEQLLKALLHQAFEVKEMEVEKPKGKVVELKPNNPNWDNLVAEPIVKYATNPINKIQDKDLEMAIMVACMKKKLGVTYGDVGLQKNVFNTNNMQQIFSKKYDFINSNFGTFSQELKEDLKRNPYLSSQKVANNKEVYEVNQKYNTQILDKLTDPENKEFVQSIYSTLSIYEHPFINKETDKIELYNTILKIALDKNTRDIDVIYQGMKDWGIKQEKFKSKAEKFTKPDSSRMLNLLIEKGIL